MENFYLIFCLVEIGMWKNWIVVRLSFLAWAVPIMVGCDPGVSGRDAPLPAPKARPIGALPDQGPASGRNHESSERLIGGMKFEFPGDWEEQSASSDFLLAEYRLPGTAGPGRLTFSTAGGGTTANIDRWKDQFQRGPGDPEPKESQITAAGKVATLIVAQGTFNDMLDKSRKPNWQILGVAIPIDADHNYFVKLTGPRETVTARRDEFLKFVESARFE